MDKSIFIRADELAVELDVSKALAYKMINQWNEELKAKGYTTVGGRVSRCLRIRMPKRVHGMQPFTIRIGKASRKRN